MGSNDLTVAEGRSGGDLMVLDFESGERVSVAVSDGYDGGPFFSPDGKRLCYRSDLVSGSPASLRRTRAGLMPKPLRRTFAETP